MVNPRDWPWIPPTLIWVDCVAGCYVQVSLWWSYLHSRDEQRLKLKECGHNNLGESYLQYRLYNY